MRWSFAGIPRRGLGFHKGVLDKPSTSGGLFRVLGLVASEGLGFIGFRVYALTTRTSQAGGSRCGVGVILGTVGMLTSLQVGERRVWDFGFRVAVRAKGSQRGIDMETV